MREVATLNGAAFQKKPSFPAQTSTATLRIGSARASTQAIASRRVMPLAYHPSPQGNTDGDRSHGGH